MDAYLSTLGRELTGTPLFLVSAMPDFPAAEHHCHLAGTKLYCLVTGP